MNSTRTKSRAGSLYKILHITIILLYDSDIKKSWCKLLNLTFIPLSIYLTSFLSSTSPACHGTRLYCITDWKRIIVPSSECNLSFWQILSKYVLFKGVKRWQTYRVTTFLIYNITLKYGYKFEMFINCCCWLYPNKTFLTHCTLTKFQHWSLTPLHLFCTKKTILKTKLDLYYNVK